MKAKKPFNFQKAFKRERVKLLKGDNWSTVKTRLIEEAKAKREARHAKQA